MSEIIHMDFQKMQEMAERFKVGAQQLEEIRQAIENLAQTFENGALLGHAGDQFTNDLRCGLAPAINRLHDKFHELQSDILAAMIEMHDREGDVGVRFRG